jgi:hypothetical protein
LHGGYYPSSSVIGYSLDSLMSEIGSANSATTSAAPDFSFIAAIRAAPHSVSSQYRQVLRSKIGDSGLRPPVIQITDLKHLIFLDPKDLIVEHESPETVLGPVFHA